MNITRKPRARPIVVTDELRGITFKGFRASFDGWGVGFVSATLGGALALAHRMHAHRINMAREGKCPYPFEPC